MPQHMPQHRDCLDEARRLYTSKICLTDLSKDTRGRLLLTNADVHECEQPKCETLKTIHCLIAEMRGHDCDSELASLLDGRLVVRRLVTAFTGPSGDLRGTHTGEFEWTGQAAHVVGTLSGITNAGTHREPAFDACQECRAPGYMEGRLCGTVVRSKVEELKGCLVTAAYRLRYTPENLEEDAEFRGTIEGVVVCPCRPADEKCIDFSNFAVGGYPNPWTIGGCTFTAFDFSGAQTPSIDVVDWGAPSPALNVNYETRIALATPASEVTLQLSHYSQPATATAYAGGAVVDSETMALGGGLQTITLNGLNIDLVTIEAPQNETLLHSICVT